MTEERDVFGSKCKELALDAQCIPGLAKNPEGSARTCGGVEVSVYDKGVEGVGQAQNCGH